LAQVWFGQHFQGQRSTCRRWGHIVAASCTACDSLCRSIHQL